MDSEGVIARCNKAKFNKRQTDPARGSQTAIRLVKIKKIKNVRWCLTM